MKQYLAPIIVGVVATVVAMIIYDKFIVDKMNMLEVED